MATLCDFFLENSGSHFIPSSAVGSEDRPPGLGTPWASTVLRIWATLEPSLYLSSKTKVLEKANGLHSSRHTGDLLALLGDSYLETRLQDWGLRSISQVWENSLLCSHGRLPRGSENDGTSLSDAEDSLQRPEPPSPPPFFFLAPLSSASQGPLMGSRTVDA